MKFSDLKKLRNLPVATAPKPQPQEAPAPVPVPDKTDTAPARQAAAPQAAIPAATPPAKREPQPREKAKPAPKPPPGPSLRELNARAKEAYTRLIEQSAELLRRIEQPYTEQYDTVLRACRAAAAALKDNPALLGFTSYATEPDYLYAHIANTTIFSLALGRASGLEGKDLDLLGFCAMAHDIGMTDYRDLYNRKDRLSEEEFSEITLHTEAGMRKLDRIVDLDYKLKERASLILLQTHERIDGTGYPDRLSAEQIDPFAQIIGIADVYEAMTHPRPWRGAMNPPDVIRELIAKEGRGFSSKTVKTLIAVLSIYPPNSIVTLSTGETARVIQVNGGSLTKPVVELLLDAEFNPAPARVVDLIAHPLTSIDRPVSCEEIARKNPDFAAQLCAPRWWTMRVQENDY